MTVFKDRSAAGKLLANRLENYKFDHQKTLVISIPRGGVVVGFEIADAYKMSLRVVITRKIGDPFQKELAIGAVDPTGNVYWEEDYLKKFKLKKEDLNDEIKQAIKEIHRREREYSGAAKLEIAGKAVILVDDGIATGATIFSAIEYLKSLKVKQILVAVPVVSKDVFNKLAQKVDGIISLVVAESLSSVGSYFQDFGQISDEEVIRLLKKV